MTDRELLELAARAAGVDYVIDSFNSQKGLIHEPLTDCEEGHPVWWNPLDSIADCNNIAKKCNFDIVKITIQSKAKTASETRRAITRAAAEIGKTL